MKSRKGTTPWFIGLSVLGILVALFMAYRGWGGSGLGAGLTLAIGVFFVITEVLDIFH